jgi:hypothetical protein
MQLPHIRLLRVVFIQLYYQLLPVVINMNIAQHLQTLQYVSMLKTLKKLCHQRWQWSQTVLLRLLEKRWVLLENSNIPSEYLLL